MIESSEIWVGVPPEAQSKWNSAFSESSKNIKVAATCPVCNSNSLYRWHDGYRGLWEWCQTCKVYEHSTSLVPKGWAPEVNIVPVGLTAEPEAIVRELINVGFIKR